ncbi:YesU family protein [Paenibacillus sp. OAS669]|uniref:YesU family protein n=1 Tax=Paenibacillus sp. OAS669 TaxID=2663821 RepID=UPI001789E51E|nr:YesU family protein [Paenibacillus sp. OAS669]
MIYYNPLAAEKDVSGFRLEGEASASFPNGAMRMENKLDPEEGQASNFVFWCPETFPADIAVAWDFRPIREPGLCMLFFAAAGRQGEDLFAPHLAKRTGPYEHYHNGDINALHVSYFRRRYPEERAFHTCNLRKSHGAHLVCQGADPIPDVEDAQGVYRMELIKQGADIAFSVNGLTVLRWTDDGCTYGPRLGGGKIGFRQMAPLVGEYANLTVYALK